MMPFEQMRVVEIGSGVALAYCGKLFADFGAEVIKAEPLGGDARMREHAAAGGDRTRAARRRLFRLAEYQQARHHR